MQVTLSKAALGEQTFQALNMMFDASMRIVENHPATVPVVSDGWTVLVELTGSKRYVVTLRANHAGGLALVSGIYDCSKNSADEAMIYDAMYELAKMVAGGVRNVVACDHRLGETATLLSNDTLKAARLIVGTRLSLGNDEAAIDVALSELLPEEALDGDAEGRSSVFSVVLAQRDEKALAALHGAIQSDSLRVVAHAQDGLQLLEMVGQLHPDVVFLDFEMKSLSGLQVLARLRQDTPDILVFIVATAPTASVVRAALRLHPAGIVVTPFDRPRLLLDIGSALARRQH
jgi:CheY-like chemotaxis protein